MNQRRQLQLGFARALQPSCISIYVRACSLQDKSRRARPELVERGQLTLAQDAVLG